MLLQNCTKCFYLSFLVTQLLRLLPRPRCDAILPRTTAVARLTGQLRRFCDQKPLARLQHLGSWKDKNVFFSSKYGQYGCMVAPHSKTNRSQQGVSCLPGSLAKDIYSFGVSILSCSEGDEVTVRLRQTH